MTSYPKKVYLISLDMVFNEPFVTIVTPLQLYIYHLNHLDAQYYRMQISCNDEKLSDTEVEKKISIVGHMLTHSRVYISAWTH